MFLIKKDSQPKKVILIKKMSVQQNVTKVKNNAYLGGVRGGLAKCYVTRYFKGGHINEALHNG